MWCDNCSIACGSSGSFSASSCFCLFSFMLVLTFLNSLKISSGDDKHRLAIYNRIIPILSNPDYVGLSVGVAVAQREEAARDDTALDSLLRQDEDRRYSPSKATREEGAIVYSVSLFLLLLKLN